MKIVYYLFVLADKIVAKVPVGIIRALAHAGAGLYLVAFPRKRRQVEKNMRRALGPGATDEEVKRTAFRAGRCYADYYVDIFWLPTQARESVLEKFGRINEAGLEAAVAAGKGLIVVLPHYGSWEAGAVYLSSLGPFAAVAEVLKPPELFDMFVRLRAAVGIDIFPYDSKPETRDRMVEALQGGTTLALLSDRDLKGTGVAVEFFGERTTLPPGPAVLAMRSGSPIVCVNVRNVDGGWVGHAMDPIQVEAEGDKEEIIARTMQQMAANLEVLIREDPAQWHMFMPAWPSDRE
ncbi:MAG TPA: phosphatidylinositol mannoside acyltransferase [Candidatus Anoxymicrobiaceae bacterium]